METLKNFVFEDLVIDLVEGFAGIEDSNAICNFKLHGRTVQVRLSLIDEDEGDFNGYEGVPLIEL